MAEKTKRKAAVNGRFKVRLLETALRKLYLQLEGDAEIKATVGDLIRLIEAHGEMTRGEGPKEVTVRWVEDKTPPVTTPE